MTYTTEEILEVDMASDTVKKKTFHTDHYSEFVRSQTNLRKNVNRPELQSLIKNDGGVLDCVWVLPASYNVEGKKVIYEGNSRHFSLEVLDNDPTYSGSRDLPYHIIPEEVAGDEKQLLKFMLNANATNKRVSPQEQWQGIKQLLDIFQAQEPAASEKKPRAAAAKLVAAYLGQHVSWIQKMIRVYEANANPELLELVESGTLSIELADAVRLESEKINKKAGEEVVLPVDLAREALLLAVEDGKDAKVTPKYLSQAVENASINPEELVEDSEKIDSSGEYQQEKSNSEEEEEGLTKEEIIGCFQESKDFVNSWTLEDLEALEDSTLLKAAKKMDSFTMDKALRVLKSQEDVETLDDVESVETLENVENVEESETVEGGELVAVEESSLLQKSPPSRKRNKITHFPEKVAFRFSETQLKNIEKGAQYFGCSLSDYMRLCAKLPPQAVRQLLEKLEER